jgi:thiol-disulfide isomerase/thioredoxin
MSLVSDFGNYQYHRVVIHNMKTQEKYDEKPEVYFSFEEKGMLKLSDSDRELLKKWQQRRMVRKEKELSVHNQEQYMALMDELEKICADGEIDAFVKRDDVKKVYDGWAPKPVQVTANVIDSLHNEQIMRDYCRAYLLGMELVHTKKLRDVSVTMLDDIKDGYLRQQIVDLKNHCEELARQNEEKVKNVIAPSSNVEGLTDGKAIIDKIIEPYKGKIVYMDIWGTWCQPCINAIKSSPKLKEAVKDYDIVYVYFAGQSEEAAWKGCIAELGLTKPNYVHYNLPQNQQDAVFKYLNLDGFPFYVLFDKQGNMEKLDRGHIGNVEGFKKKIEELSKK